ncbi:MAG: tetratricopeptide repeat protein [Thermodesulfobacteriota bacterium]
MNQSPDASASLDRAIAHHQAGRLQVAEAIYLEILRGQPNDPDCNNLLGTLYCQQGRAERGLHFIEAALALKPTESVYLVNYGVTLMALGRFPEAITALTTALRANPGSVQALNNLGNAQLAMGREAEAAAALTTALQLRPADPQIHNNLGLVHLRAGRLSTAKGCFAEAVRLSPSYAEAWSNIGNACGKQGRISEAVASYERAISCRPGFASAHSNLLMTLNYSPELTGAEMARRAHSWWERHGKNVQGAATFANEPDPDRPLRIGYVSADLRRHSVSSFLLPLLAGHDRQKIVTYCYANVERPDDITERIRRAAVHWRSVFGQNDERFCELIRADRIDILVDLSGHTAGNRLPVFCRRPAPLQVSWLGYPSTTGIPVIDYRLTDDIADPDGDSFYSEKLFRLPGCFLCYAPLEPAPAVQPAPFTRNGFVTFASFNNPAKINDAVAACWAAILDAVPGSLLLLKGKPFADEPTARHYRDLFGRFGVAAARIRMLPATRTISEHLQLYGEVDIALDPFPYNGTTTTCEALWMGVPVVVLAGHSHAGRVGASILHALGLERQLLATTPGDYVEKAVQLAGGDFVRIADRQQMRATMANSSLCDAGGFAAKIEIFYRRIWRDWCGGAAC